MLKTFRTIFFSSIILFFFITTASFYKIFSDVKDISVRAKNVMGQECIPSLISYFESIYCVPDDKTKVIWALGQIADKSALFFLNEVEVNFECSKNESYLNYDICYETSKAIKWCNQGNITSWMYKNRSNW